MEYQPRSMPRPMFSWEWGLLLMGLPRRAQLEALH